MITVKFNLEEKVFDKWVAGQIAEDHLPKDVLDVTAITIALGVVNINPDYIECKRETLIVEDKLKGII